MTEASAAPFASIASSASKPDQMFTKKALLNLQSGSLPFVTKGSEVALTLLARPSSLPDSAPAQAFFSSDEHHGGPLIIKAGEGERVQLRVASHLLCRANSSRTGRCVADHARWRACSAYCELQHCLCSKLLLMEGACRIRVWRQWQPVWLPRPWKACSGCF